VGSRPFQFAPAAITQLACGPFEATPLRSDRFLRIAEKKQEKLSTSQGSGVGLATRLVKLRSTR
jgi:hypothetical protein